MLLRVECYSQTSFAVLPDATSGGDEAAAPPPKEGQKLGPSEGQKLGPSVDNVEKIQEHVQVQRPDFVWHVSPGCCGSVVKNGLFSVGRKQCDLNLSTDKSVSRSHCSLRLVHEDGDAAVLEAGRSPETEEEEGACRKAADGIVAVVHDVGSRYGTFVVVEQHEDDEEEEEEEDDGERNKKESKKGDDDDEDATDDEMPASSIVVHPEPKKWKAAGSEGRHKPESASQVAVTSEAMSQAVSSILQTEHHATTTTSSSTTTWKVDAGKSMVLQPLSLPRHKTKRRNRRRREEERARSVMIQCGQGGSTLRMVRVPLAFCLSSKLPRAAKQLVQKNLHRLGGALVTPTLDIFQTTHFITTPEDGGAYTAKVVAAWVLNVPVVTLDFIQALLDRTQPSDPLPAETDYAAFPPDLALPSPLATKSLLKGMRFVCLEKNPDVEAMVLAAGAAAVLPAYSLATDEEFFTEWFQETAPDFQILGFANHSPTRKTIKTVWIVDLQSAVGTPKLRGAAASKRKKQQEKRKGFLEQHKIPTVSTRELATAITEVRPLQLEGDDDEDGDDAGQEKEEEEGKPKAEAKKDDPNDANEQEKPVSSNDDGAVAEKDAVDSASKGNDEKAKDVEMPETTSPEDKTKEDSDKASRGNQASQPATDKEVVPEAPSKMETEKPQGEKDHAEEQQGGESEPRPSTKRSRSDMQEDAKAEPEEQIKRKKKDNDDDDNDDEQGGAEKEESQEAWKKPVNGWLTAAPPQHKNKKRRIQSAKDEEDDEEGMPQAVTVAVKTLVARPHPPTPSPTPTPTPSPCVVDFKRFRKNIVLSGQGQRCVLSNKIRLQAFLPKETERQRQLELSQQELQREQEAADALFADGAAGRRRGGAAATSNTMRDYFASSQQTPQDAAITPPPRARGGGRRGTASASRRRGQ